jgi:SSS family solute:Na+ symporter
MFSSVFYATVPETGIVPDMIRNISNPVLSSMIFVGLCAAIMSTMDSLFNTGALSLSVDVYKQYIKPDASPARSVKIARLSTFIIAMSSLFIALKIQSVLTISWIASDFLTSGAFIPLILGFMWARGTSIAATVSMLFGLAFSSYNLLVALGVKLPVSYEIASAKQAIIGIVISLFLYVLISLFTKGDMEKSKAFILKANVLNR